MEFSIDESNFDDRLNFRLSPHSNRFISTPMKWFHEVPNLDQLIRRDAAADTAHDTARCRRSVGTQCGGQHLLLEAICTVLYIEK